MKDIILIHGTWCDGSVWGEFATELEKLGLRVHTPSLRYHDLPYKEVEEKVAKVSLNDYVEDIVELVESLDEPPIVLGHSLGGINSTASWCENESRRSYFNGNCSSCRYFCILS